jgi:HK97 family phage portal protein
MKLLDWRNPGMARGRTSSFSNPEAWVELSLGAVPATAGVNVSVESALRHSAVFKCVKILAETVSMLPLLLYRRLADGGQDRAHTHALYKRLRWMPNTEMSSYTWRVMMNVNLCTRGNAYSWVQRNGFNDVVGLWPIPAQLVQMKRDVQTQELEYWVTIPGRGSIVKIPPRNMLHIKGLTLDGLTGVSPIEYERESIGLSMASEQYGAKFYGNGGQPKGVLEHPGALGEDAGKHLKLQFEENYGTLTNAQKTLILEEGMSYKAISVSPKDALYLDARRYSALDIAGIFRVPPHMINELERATFSNIEHMGMSFVTYTLAPWLVAWEQEIYRTLFTEAEQDVFFVEHLVDALQRGDLLTRYRAYAIGRQNSWLNADDIRRIENMAPIPNGAGAEYLAPRNMAPLDMLGAIEGTGSGASQSTAGDTSADQGGGARDMDWQPLAEELAGRIVRRAVADVCREAEKRSMQEHPEALRAWQESYFARNSGEHAAWVATAVQPYLQAAGVDDAATQARSLADWWCARALQAPEALLDGGCREALVSECAGMLASYPAEVEHA